MHCLEPIPEGRLIQVGAQKRSQVVRQSVALTAIDGHFRSPRAFTPGGQKATSTL
jgi:hypothetical protein